MKKTTKIIIIVVLILTLGVVLIKIFKKSEPVSDGSDCDKEFGLYTANLDGSNMKLLISDPYREMNHARVSPNGQWVTFSRFNNVGEDGCATEMGEGFLNTEVVVMAIDGTRLKSLSKPSPKKSIINSYWVTDNSLLYMYLTEGAKSLEIRKVYFDKNMNIINEERLNIPDHLGVGDPSQVGEKVVFAVASFLEEYKLFGYDFPEKDGIISGIWIMNEDGTDLHPLTILRDHSGDIIIRRKGKTADSDPKLSPDGTKVVFQRRTIYDEWNDKDKHNWHIYVVDVDSPMTEVDISAQHLVGPFVYSADAMSEWLDNQTIVFWCIDVTNPSDQKYEVCTMKYDGSERKKIPLPEEYDYRMPAPFPGEGSGEDARIIFTTIKTKD